MTKVIKLTKEQAQALECVRETESNEWILRTHMATKNNKKMKHWAGKAQSLDTLSIDDMARALYVGYSIQKPSIKEQISNDKSVKVYGIMDVRLTQLGEEIMEMIGHGDIIQDGQFGQALGEYITPAREGLLDALNTLYQNVKE